jgi:hypothetical protein
MTYDPLAPEGTLSCVVDMAGLRGMTMEELRALQSALHTLEEVVAAFTCQPRFNHHKFGDPEPNAAGTAIGKISAFLQVYEQAVVNVAVAAKPTTEWEVMERAWTILAFETLLADDVAAVAARAADIAQDVASAIS